MEIELSHEGPEIAVRARGSREERAARLKLDPVGAAALAAFSDEVRAS